MAKKRRNKKEEAFALFDQGYGPSSPEVKSLKLKGNTRYTYHTEWGKAKESGRDIFGESLSESHGNTGEEIIMPGRVTKGGMSERDLTIVRDDEVEESIESGEDSTSEKEVKGAEDEKQLPPATPGISDVDVSVGKKDGKKGIPRDIIGQGIRVTVDLSVKTLALYQIAANLQEEQLTLGDFLDTCAEDMYRVRGKDLGLVQLRRES